MGKDSGTATGGGHVYDSIGIGFGPSNMALAIALEECGRLDNCLFLEASETFGWHPGMQIRGADIQHNPLRDLVTPRNPASPYGFLSYLKAHDRLFEYLNLDAPYPPRSDYAAYIGWVGAQFADHVRMGTTVQAIRYADGPDGEKLLEVLADDGTRHFGRTLNFGTGRSALIPGQFLTLLGDDVVHLTHYLFAKDRWLKRLERPRVAVIGGSQSAAEIVLDLADCADVTSISRSFGFKHKDLSPFTESIYLPEFVDYFHAAGVAGQNRMTQELWRSNYGAADPDVVAALNLRLYEQKVTGGTGLKVLHNRAIDAVTRDAAGGYRLHLTDKYSGMQDVIAVDGVVLATGYRNFGSAANQEPFHPLLSDIAEFALFREDGGVEIDRDFRLRTDPAAELPPVFLNGLCEASHGFGDAGSFSLLSVRSARIAAAMALHLDHRVRPAEPAMARESRDRVSLP